LYGKALVNGIDAPQQPKVSHNIGLAAVANGGSSAGDKPSERYTLRQIERRVKQNFLAELSLWETPII
jgi:hypothetical protein